MDLNNWIASVDQSLPISLLSIPGTHESCARYDHATAGYTQCQWLSITDQLHAGIRFLDIRCTYEVGGKPFEITHGGYDQKISFAQVQAEVIAFLDRHPGEFVMMNVQQEYSSNTNAQFVARFDQQVSGHEDYWFFDERIPAVSECKKHIVLVRAYDALNFDPNTGKGGWNTGKGIPWNGFDIDGKSANNYFLTQNAWTAYESDKLKAIKEMFQLPVIGNQFILNFLSYAHFGATPGRNAEAMNPAIFAYIKTLASDCPLGVVPMDFATNTPGFIEEIIGHNQGALPQGLIDASRIAPAADRLQGRAAP